MKVSVLVIAIQFAMLSVIVIPSSVSSLFVGNAKERFLSLFFETLGDISNTVVDLEIENLLGLRFPDPTIVEEDYDFVIVGSGPAGSVLANRLSEGGKYSVLLIEAGSPEVPLTSMLPLSSPNLQSTNFNWGYATERQPRACWGTRDNRCQWPHGKVLGGSSVLYYMIYTRGNRRDFDRWARAGNPGWSWDEVLPYFLKSENSTLDYASPLHGHDGPLPVEDVPYRTPIARANILSAQEAGYRYVDYNAGDQIGVSYLQQSTLNGRRVSAARAFLYPIQFRKNLHIAWHSLAKKLIVERGADGKLSVKGVVVKQRNSPDDIIVRARKEVILSAGAFESAKLLMLSGIGPADHLRELGIPLRKHLPVGETLYEHIGTFGPVFTVQQPIDELINLERILTLRHLKAFVHGRGPFTMNGVESLIYLNTNLTEPDPGLPDVEIMQAFASMAFDTGGGTAAGLNLRDDVFEAVFRPIENQRAFFFLPTLLHPRSVGYMRLRSANSRDLPIFEPNFYSDPVDLEALLRAMKEAIRITRQPSFQRLGVKLYTPELPTCPDAVPGSDAYLRCWAQTISAPFHHQVATCKMGPAADPSTVVNHRLMVHGFDNLRVADIGILPGPPSGHTNAYAFMIGEKAADMVKEKWEFKPPRPPPPRPSEPVYEWQTAARPHHFSSNHLDYYTMPANYHHDFGAALLHDRYKRSATMFDWQKPIVTSSTENEEKQNKNVIKKAKVEIEANGTTVSAKEDKETAAAMTTSHGNRRPADDNSDRPNDLHIILRPSEADDISHTKMVNRSASPPVLPLAESASTKGESELPDDIPDQIPSADEDAIRTVDLDNSNRFNRGKNKPILVTNQLMIINTTVFEEADFPKDNQTRAVRLPVLDGKLDEKSTGSAITPKT